MSSLLHQVLLHSWPFPKNHPQLAMKRECPVIKTNKANSFASIYAETNKPMKNQTKAIVLVSALLLWSGMTWSAHAALRVWSGSAPMDPTWANANNWAGNVAPLPGDDLQFPFGALHPNATATYPAGTTFNSIMFWHGGSGGSSTSYNLGGNSIALNAGISTFNNSGVAWANSVNNALILNSNQTFTLVPFTSLSLFGPINLKGNYLTFDTAQFSPADVKAVLSGAGGLSKTNAGTLTLYSNNTYTGTTTLSGGLLQMLNGAPASPILLNLGTLHALGTVGTITSLGSGSPGSIVLSPGGNTAILTCSNVLLRPATTFVTDLNGTTAGSGYDQLNV